MELDGEVEATLTSFYDDLQDRCEQRLGAPVLAAGVYNLAGGLDRMAVTHVSRVAAWGMRKKAQRDTGGLPKRSVMAVTADSVVVFATEYKKRKEELTDVVATWPRDQVRVVEVHAVSLFTRVTFEVDGNRFPLDGAQDERALRIV